MTSADRLLGDEELQNNLRRGLAELPQTLRDTRQAIAGFEQTLELANRNLRNLEGFTEPLGRRGDEFFGKLDRSVGKAEILLDRLVTFGDALNNREGSLGRLTSDAELYDNLNQRRQERGGADASIASNSCYDVRVFTDKIARDPGRLGVRGVFQQNSGIK